MLGFGPHLVMDARGCVSRRLDDISGLYKLLDSFPAKIGMTKIMPPYVFAHGEPGTAEYGLSGFVLIAESHISIHTFPLTGQVKVDIFSCEQFDVRHAVGLLRDHFKPKKCSHRVLQRGMEFPRRIDLSREVVENDRRRVRAVAASPARRRAARSGTGALAVARRAG
jgi:S-adenosylmethionine decarboxylase